MPESGPTKGAGRRSQQSSQWESHPLVARCLRLLIWVAPLATAVTFSTVAAKLAPPERLGMNRWIWILAVFAIANLLLSIMRRLIERLTPLVALMKLTLVFPDQAPSRAKATLRKSSSRSMLREMEAARESGEQSGEVLYGDYLVQLLTEVNEHDRLTRGHSERVRAYAEMLGDELGLSDDDMNKLRWSALLHDVGKLDVPSEILNKPGRPTEEEWKVLSGHPAGGGRMLEPLRDWLGDWVHSADQHHCRWDGGGYPSDLAGTEIALSGRIVAVADAYDVMTSARSYKKPLSAEIARQELTDCAGSQFDPAMVRAFLRVSLGQLRTVAGPFGWVANLLASAQAKVPIAATISSGATSAAAVVAVAAAGVMPDSPPETLAMVEPVAITMSDVDFAGLEDSTVPLEFLADGGIGTLVFSVSGAEHGTVELGVLTSRSTIEESAIDDTTDPDGQGLADLNVDVVSAADPDVAADVDRWVQTASYRPAPNFFGDDEFTVDACDGVGTCVSATARVTLQAANDSPEARDDRRPAVAGSSIEIDVLANDRDIDGDPLTVIDVEQGIGGQAIVADNKVVYVPAEGFVGTDTFRYTIADPGEASSVASVSVEVSEETVLEPASVDEPPPTSTTVPPTTAPSTTELTTTEPPTTTAPPTTAPPVIDLSPIAGDDSVTTDEDASILIDVLANDSDDGSDPVTITGVGLAQNGTVSIETGQIRYEPDLNYNGADGFTYVISDGVNPQVTANVSVTVTPLNDAPVVAGPPTVTLSEDSAIGTSVAILGSYDADGDALSYTITAGDAGGRFAINAAGEATVATTLDYETATSYLLQFGVSDGTVVTPFATTVTVTDVNEVAVAADDSGASFSTSEDVLLTTGNVLDNDNDPDGPIDPAGITVTGGPSNGTLTDNGDGTFDYDPDPEWSGIDSFTYTLTDAGPLTSNTATVTIPVAIVNDPPAVTQPGTQTGAEGTPFSLQISASDVELDGLSYGASGLPAGLSINATGLISGTPNAGTQGSHNVDVTVTDDGTGPAQTTVSFTIDIGYHLVSAEAGNIAINEVLYNTVSVAAPEEFIELHNASAGAVNLTGWTLNDANLKADGAEDLSFTFPATDHWGTASSLATGEYAVVWVVYDGANLPPLVNPTGGLEYVISVAGTKLDDAGDDLWLLDTETRIVDYMAYGGGAAVGTPPEAALNQWDATSQSTLFTASAEAIALAVDGTDSNTSDCWEPVASNDATGRCAGALITSGSVPLGVIASSVGRTNNGGFADAGGPYAIAEGESLTLDGSASVGAATWNWDLDNDGQYDDATGVNPTVTWATLAGIGVDDDGVYSIAVEVDGGDADAASATISNVAPVLSTTGAATVSTGSPYTLNLGVTDPGDDTISGWTINWGDGTIDSIVGNPATVSHTYSGVGFTYNITASATDEDGTVLQNELLVPSYDGDEVFRYAATSGNFVQNFAATTVPVQALVGPDGQLYVSGQSSDNVERYNAQTGAYVDEFVSSGSGGLNAAGGMAFGPDGNFYVTRTNGGHVLRYDGISGAHIDTFVSGSASESYGAIFGPDGNLYVGSFNQNNVDRFDGATGAFIDTFVSSGDGGLDSPEQMVFGPDGNLYVSSLGTDEVLRYDGSTGAFIDIFVAAGGAGGLNEPTGLAFGPDGQLYVSDFQDHAILRYNGTTGAFIDQYVTPGSGGLTEPVFITFLPELQVTITP
ncbi:MAG: Ig-like domain-containing protein [Acidimicrobiales bacterium]